MVKIYRQDIDGLRAIAVILVILYHAFPQWFGGGYLGVDVFFVISGYLISQILCVEIENHQWCWTTFYSRRIKRILPSLLLVLVVLMLLGYFLLLDPEYQSLNLHVLASSFFLNNILLWSQTPQYFDPGSHFKPLLHLWSLGVEEQFYLFWPAFIYFLYQKKISKRYGIGALMLVSLLACVVGHDTFYLPLCRIWELGLGGMLCFYQPVLLRRHSYLGVVAFLVLLGLATWVYFKNSLLVIMMATLSTAILIIYPGVVNRRVLSQPTLVFLGMISYPLYLWHWSLLSFAHIIAAGAISTYLTILILIVSVILSGLTYVFIEKPIRMHPSNQWSWVLLIILFIIGAIGGNVYYHHGLPGRPIDREAETLIADMTQFDSYQKRAVHCLEGGLDVCMQNKPGSPEFLLWGDSHAEHLFPGLMDMDNGHDWMLLTSHTCPPLLGVKAYWSGQQDTCVMANQRTLTVLTKTPSIKTVVVAFVGLFYLSNEIAPVELGGPYSPGFFHLELLGDSTLDKSKVVIQGLENTIEALLSMGKKVVIVEDNPLLPFMPSACIQRPLQPTSLYCQLPLDTVMKIQNDYHQLLERVIRQYPQVSLYRSMDALCNDRFCPVLLKHHLLYRDSQHLSLAGSAIVAKGLLTKLQPQSHTTL